VARPATKHVICWSGGKDSTASIILAHLNGLPVDLILFVEVMFDRDISGERPEQMEFVKRCTFIFESWGYPVKVIHSDRTYMDVFMRVREWGGYVGMRAGFPLPGACEINRDCKLRAMRNFWRENGGEDIVQYVGIAADEPARLKRLPVNAVSLLARYGYTQEDAYWLCSDYGLLSPCYEYAARGGCWFCPNATRNELRALWRDHNELWNKLLELEKVPNVINNIWNRRSRIYISQVEEELCQYEM